MNAHQYGAHQHDMARTGTIYKCTSCAFKCTLRAVSDVRASVSRHRVIKANSPQAKEIWDVKR